MAEHLAFMETCIHWSEEDVNTNHRHKIRQVETKKHHLDNQVPAVIATQTEAIARCGSCSAAERVFVLAIDSGSYGKVGWILQEHVNSCMICNDPFGFFLSKHHCRACGNVICSKCSPEKG